MLVVQHPTSLGSVDAARNCSLHDRVAYLWPRCMPKCCIPYMFSSSVLLAAVVCFSNACRSSRRHCEILGCAELSRCICCVSYLVSDNHASHCSLLGSFGGVFRAVKLFVTAKILAAYSPSRVKPHEQVCMSAPGTDFEGCGKCMRWLVAEHGVVPVACVTRPWSFCCT